MDFMRGIVIWGGVAVAAGALGGVLAGVKNRDLSSWIAWCFVLPPLVFILLLLPRYQGVRPRRPRLDEGEERGW
jgi:membrane protein DedA with SNARE-associated domain